MSEGDTDTDDLRDVIEKAKTFSEVLPEDIAAAEAIVANPDSVPLRPKLAEENEQVAAPAPGAASGDEEFKDIRAQIAGMTIPQKIKLALFGNSICRGLLILDASRMIQQFVLKNPKLAQSEVETFAKNPQIAEGVIRTISDSKKWMKSGNLRYIVVTNPKTPGDIALKWLRYLPLSDLRKIAKSKNLPQLIAVTAKKRVAEADEK